LEAAWAHAKASRELAAANTDEMEAYLSLDPYTEVQDYESE
ncbi:hypothetical protein scyTo_0026003, partial [Scyliorhinus torazame]|nr:hypothetical protein [Scyliorhinus torazame]